METEVEYKAFGNLEEGTCVRSRDAQQKWIKFPLSIYEGKRTNAIGVYESISD